MIVRSKKSEIFENYEDTKLWSKYKVFKDKIEMEMIKEKDPERIFQGRHKKHYEVHLSLSQSLNILKLKLARWWCSSCR